MGRISRDFEFYQNTGKRRKEKSCIQAAIMECLQLSVNKGVLKTILQCNNPSRRGNRQSFPRSLASSTFAYLPDNLKIQRTSRRIVFQPDRGYLSLIFASPNRFVQDQVWSAIKKQEIPGHWHSRLKSLLFYSLGKLRQATASACRVTWNVRTWPANVRTRPTNFDFYPGSSFKCRTCASRRVTSHVNVFLFARENARITQAQKNNEEYSRTKKKDGRRYRSQPGLREIEFRIEVIFYRCLKLRPPA